MNAIDSDKLARKRRRRRNKAAGVLLFALACVGLAWFFESQATTTLIFVRHAEKADVVGDNPGLSIAGTARAIQLARLLGDADVIAGVDEIYVSQFRRTIDTARPLARRLNIDPRGYEASNIDGTMRTILTQHKGKIVLVVGHSNTIAPMVAELGGSKRVPEIADDEYDNLYIVTIPWFGKVKTLRIRFGAGVVTP